MEVLVEIIFEVLLEVVLEVFFELGFYGIVAVSNKKQHSPVLKFVGYSLLGALAGLLSLVFFGELFVSDPSLQLANLVFTPVIAGAIMYQIGRWKHKKGYKLLSLDKFFYGTSFAFAMTLVRYLALSGVMN
jgi:hypothetical protein